jgi:hypothetical protein
MHETSTTKSIEAFGSILMVRNTRHTFHPKSPPDVRNADPVVGRICEDGGRTNGAYFDYLD